MPWIQHKIEDIFCSEIVALASEREEVRKQAHLVGVGELTRWSDMIDFGVRGRNNELHKTKAGVSHASCKEKAKTKAADQ